MDAISFIAERKIEQAIDEGQFDNLPGMGKPLALEDLSQLPPELRMAYTILKNSGHIETLPPGGPEDPKPVSTRELLQHCPEESKAYGNIQRLNVMMGRVRRARETERPARAAADAETVMDANASYLEKLLTRV